MTRGTPALRRPRLAEDSSDIGRACAGRRTSSFRGVLHVRRRAAEHRPPRRLRTILKHGVARSRRRSCGVNVYFSHSYHDVAVNGYFLEHFLDGEILLHADQKTDVWCVAKLERYLGELDGFVSVIPRRPTEDDSTAFSPYIGQELSLARRAACRDCCSSTARSLIGTASGFLRTPWRFRPMRRSPISPLTASP